MRKLVLILMITILALNACSFLMPKPTPTPEPTATIAPTETPFPTPTSVVIPVDEPTDTPQAAREEGRHYEDYEKFSYVPIEGWEIQEFPGLTTKILMATDQSSIGVNLVFVPEVFNGNTEEYANAAIATAKPVLENFVEGQKTIYKTDSGLTVVKLPATYKSQGLEISGIFYMIGDDSDLSRPKLTVTLTKFANTPATIESQVDDLVKSIRFEE